MKLRIAAPTIWLNESAKEHAASHEFYLGQNAKPHRIIPEATYKRMLAVLNEAEKLTWLRYRAGLSDALAALRSHLAKERK